MGSVRVEFFKNETEDDDKISFFIDNNEIELKFTLAVALEIEKEFEDIFIFYNSLKSVKNCINALLKIINSSITGYNIEFRQSIRPRTQDDILLFIDKNINGIVDCGRFCRAVQKIVIKDQPNNSKKK